jgi:hypothetical protein
VIYIVDNFIDGDVFKEATAYLNNGDFKKVESGGKNFYIKESPDVFNGYILEKLMLIENRELKNILSFFRVSTNELDTSWRIHSDLNIKGEKPDRALVIYMSPRYKEDLHGTALWEHEVHGIKLPDDISDDKYNEMIQVDAENLDMWRLSSVIGYEQNRIVSYPSSYFHSKYPNRSWKKGRQVFVMFYKYK